jgi:hypothetical protein
VNLVFLQVDAALETTLLAKRRHVCVNATRIAQQVVVGFIGALGQDEVVTYINDIVGQKKLFCPCNAETVVPFCFHSLKFSTKIDNYI